MHFSLKTCAAALCGAAMLSSFAASAADENVVRVATEPSFAPFEFVDEKTQVLSGFDVDLITTIVEAAGKKVEFSSMGFDGLVPALLTGAIDVAIAGMTITEERAQRVDFTDPYYDAGLAIMINNKYQDEIKSSKDLKGKTDCSQIGTSGAKYALEQEGVEVKQFNTFTEAYLELERDGCQFSVGDKPVHEFYLRKTQNPKLSLLPEFINGEQYGIAVKKGNTELLNLLNEGLKKIRADGTYDRIYAKWFGGE